MPEVSGSTKKWTSLDTPEAKPVLHTQKSKTTDGYKRMMKTDRLRKVVSRFIIYIRLPRHLAKPLGDDQFWQPQPERSFFVRGGIFGGSIL